MTCFSLVLLLLSVYDHDHDRNSRIFICNLTRKSRIFNRTLTKNSPLSISRELFHAATFITSLVSRVNSTTSSEPGSLSAEDFEMVLPPSFSEWLFLMTAIKYFPLSGVSSWTKTIFPNIRQFASKTSSKFKVWFLWKFNFSCIDFYRVLLCISANEHYTAP